jgi:hypothetical protein
LPFFLAEMLRRSSWLERRGPILPGLALVFALSLARSALGDGAPPPRSESVRVGDAVVFSLASDAPGKPAKERAARASAAIASALAQPVLGDVHVRRSGDSAVIAVGDADVVELVVADATAAGEASLDQFATDRANALRAALGSERKRSQIAETVFSLSLVVFFGLIAFYLIKRVATLVERARGWLETHADKHLTLSVKGIEIVRPAVLESSAVVGLGLVRWVGQFGIFYAWLVVVLSLFERTRGYTERLTGFVLSPLSQLFGRALAAVPVLVVAGFAALAVFVLVRFTGLFLASVARRETLLRWLPADLAPPASLLLRSGIVIAAVVFAAPVVTGSSDDSLGRAGTVVLWALGLAATPLLASGFLGATLLFDRRLGVGDHVRFQGQLGRITQVNLLELRLVSATGSEWRVPHLLLLTSPLERLGASPRVSVELSLPRAIAPARVLDALAAPGAGAAHETERVVEIVAVDATGIRYRITATLDTLAERSLLLRGALDALDAAGLAAAAPASSTAADPRPE